MPCYTPLTAYRSREVGKSSGKRAITFQRSGSFSGVPLQLPCGQCVGCRLEYSRQWAMRLVHESKLHASSWFVTLTYSDEKLPCGGTLVKRDLQLFMKRLRFKYGKGVRFYGCGEYGEKLGRPHYHVILFNVVFADLRRYSGDGPDDTLYTSSDLDGLWGHGLCVVGSVSFASCAYVARYVVKKVRGPQADSYYTRLLSDGTVVYLQPEFANMSRKPGIGHGYYMKHAYEIFAHDSVVVNGKEVSPPRFYATKFAEFDPMTLTDIKRERKRKALKRRSDSTPDRRRVREKVQLAQLGQIKRS